MEVLKRGTPTVLVKFIHIFALFFLYIKHLAVAAMGSSHQEHDYVCISNSCLVVITVTSPIIIG